MQAVRISAACCSPIAGGPPMLDAVLEWAMSGLAYGQEIRPGLIPIPIKRRKVEGYEWPIPLCSSPIFLTDSDGVEHFSRRLEIEPDLMRESAHRRVCSTGGEFKSYRLPLRVRSIARVVWFAVSVDNPARIRKELREVHAIGKKTSMGYGRVSDWSVEIVDADWSWFAPSPAGPLLMRPLPATAPLPAGLTGYRKFYGSPVPPYWHRPAYTEIVEPC